MPSPFKSAKNTNPHKEGSLNSDLFETNRDIRRAKRGIPGEASLDEMIQTKKRIKGEMRAIEGEERRAQMKETREKERREYLNPHKKGSLNSDLWETKRDIRQAKRGIEGEASLDEMKQTKSRIKGEMRQVAREERRAAK